MLNYSIEHGVKIISASEVLADKFGSGIHRLSGSVTIPYMDKFIEENNAYQVFLDRNDFSMLEAINKAKENGKDVLIVSFY